MQQIKGIKIGKTIYFIKGYLSFIKQAWYQAKEDTVCIECESIWIDKYKNIEIGMEKTIEREDGDLFLFKYKEKFSGKAYHALDVNSSINISESDRKILEKIEEKI